jgi:hypothetical protein
MSRNLITSFSLSLLNPTKKELNAMADLLMISRPLIKPTVEYIVYNNGSPIRGNIIHGRIPNIKVLAYLTSTDYNEVDLRVKDIVKPLR